MHRRGNKIVCEFIEWTQIKNKISAFEVPLSYIFHSNSTHYYIILLPSSNSQKFISIEGISMPYFSMNDHDNDCLL